MEHAANTPVWRGKAALGLRIAQVGVRARIDFPAASSAAQPLSRMTRKVA